MEELVNAMFCVFNGEYSTEMTEPCCIKKVMDLVNSADVCTSDKYKF